MCYILPIFEDEPHGNNITRTPRRHTCDCCHAISRVHLFNLQAYQAGPDEHSRLATKAFTSGTTIVSLTSSHHPLSLQGQTHLHAVCRISTILYHIRATNLAIQSRAYHFYQNSSPPLTTSHPSISKIISIQNSTRQETTRNVRIRASTSALQPPPVRPPQQTMRRLLHNRHLLVRH